MYNTQRKFDFTFSIDDASIFRDTTKKKKVLSLGNLKAPFKFMGGKTYCKGCKKKCSGEVRG